MLDRPLTLPCGAILPNRIAKAPMSDGLGDDGFNSTVDQARLYRAWSAGGSGLVMIGEVQIDRDHAERPGNLTLDARAHGAENGLARLAAAAITHGNHFWAQLGHAGALAWPTLNASPLAPSATRIGEIETRAMSVADIEDVIERFARGAARARAAGFTGVEIHAAHGFLLSQFLSPRFNQRDDAWGGSLANRSRLLIEVIRAVRAAVGADFPVGVKLNSSDFQKGGFSTGESRQVAAWLDSESIDLLEISGGSYSPDGSGASERSASPRDQTREAWFQAYAETVRAVFTRPIMLTGGLRSRRGMESALESGAADVVGLARPLAFEPDLPRQLMDGSRNRADPLDDVFRSGLPRGAETAWYAAQLLRLAHDTEPERSLDPVAALRWYEATGTAKAAAEQALINA
jgi:2,4-dienoyl-CoA reductase-like NADH-dependent reductase (Old Yellow Enzyme family)